MCDAVQLEATRALVQGSEISLQELLERADHPLILKVYDSLKTVMIFNASFIQNG
jgi:hypothetical protein